VKGYGGGGRCNRVLEDKNSLPEHNPPGLDG